MIRPVAWLVLFALLPWLPIPAPVVAQVPTDIHLLELTASSGSLVAVGAPRAVTDRDGYDNQPAFTADGSALLYTSIREGQADSYRYDLASGRTVRITRTAESEYSPTPMPGSPRFSVVRVEADSAQRLWSFAPDGVDARLVLEGVAPVGYHAWLPDGRRVALFVLGDPPTLRLADVATGEAEVVASDIGRSLQPVPGRAAVSFTHRIDGGWWIRELDVGSSAIRTVAPLPAEDAYHAWTPEGGLLTAHGTRILRRSEEAGGTWVPVADVAEWGLGPVTRLATSPDGRHLAFVADRRDP